MILRSVDFLDKLDYNGHEVRFHGVVAGNLSGILDLSRSEGDGKIHLYGRDHADEEEGMENEALDWLVDDGVLYTVKFDDIELSYSEFCDDEGVVLMFGARAGIEPEIRYQGRGNRENVLRVPEWEVIGAIRPVYQDEDEYEIDDDKIEFFSVEELLSNF